VGSLRYRTADKDFICVHASIYKIYMSGLFPTDSLFLSIPDDPCETSPMKRILAPILLVTLLFPALAFGWETTDGLVKRDGIYYKKFTDVPFTGKTTGKEQGSFRDGKRVGPWVKYHDNGQLYSKGTIKDGKEDGPWVRYWDNGKLESKGIYKDGDRDGFWVRYYEDGQLWYKGTYKDDEKDGPWYYYNKNGKLESKGAYKDGVKVKY
jgi:hypothetical protein